MKVAGVLLTGGASRRLGMDKSGIDMGDGPLAARTGRLLRSVADPALELGPGRSGLSHVPDIRPGQGPLAAVVCGWAELRRRSFAGPVLVLATDLPFLSESLLEWLAGHPGAGSVVPVHAGQPQPLCARYCPADLDTATKLFGRGARSMRELLAAIEPRLIPPPEWRAVAGHGLALNDLDTPADLEHARRAAGLLYGGTEPDR
ncbi:MAG TPA: molybdenum cofactor guanylyltransferase [Acidimicrobiales bacterium]|nr:molybdenum cofactor guanylyltransferase [Acidimicrobiales bacterium]